MRRLMSLAAFLAGATLLLIPEATALAGKREDAARFTAQLKTGTAAEKAFALGELAKLGQIQKVLIADAEPVMIGMLADKDATVRGAAARAVGMIDPDVSQVLPKLRKLLADDKVESVRVSAAAGIAALGTAGSPALPDLRKVAAENEKQSKMYRAAMNAMKSVRPKK